MILVLVVVLLVMWRWKMGELSRVTPQIVSLIVVGEQKCFPQSLLVRKDLSETETEMD